MRILAGNVGFGPSWEKTSSKSRDLSGQADNPSLSAPIYATLIEVESEMASRNIWSRPNRG
ncbi:DUF736 family protein [Rhizobium sp. 18055]|uniref:DUF736 family protein n=1 Tax=Rhizobium sp. 18055 TaxID=2681403 RepID=UPI001FCE9021|nr:DUF736 family protein [Rhizobium sp. 18055]